MRYLLSGFRIHMMIQVCLRGDIRASLGEYRARYTESNEFGRVHFQVNMTIGLDSKAKVATGGL